MDSPGSMPGICLAILPGMRDLLKDIDDAWFSDADDANPSEAQCEEQRLEALGLEASALPAPGALTPMPLPLPRHTRLSTEDANEFAQPTLAIGTVVDARVPKAPWFSDLRSLVPRRRPKPATLPPIPSMRAADRIETISDDDVVSEAPAQRKSWWRRK